MVHGQKVPLHLRGMTSPNNLSPNKPTTPNYANSNRVLHELMSSRLVSHRVTRLPQGIRINLALNRRWSNSVGVCKGRDSRTHIRSRRPRQETLNGLLRLPSYRLRLVLEMMIWMTTTMREMMVKRWRGTSCYAFILATADMKEGKEVSRPLSMVSTFLLACMQVRTGADDLAATSSLWACVSVPSILSAH